MKCYLTFIIGLTLLFITLINAKSIESLSNADKEDKYYLIYVNNEHGEYKVFSDAKNQKRDASQVFVESLVDKINTLIIDNKDTYQNPEKLEEIEEAAHLRKRGQEAAAAYHDSDVVYPISSVDDKVVLYAYLSKTLAEQLPVQIDSIIECIPDKVSATIFHQNYDVEEIMAATHWKGVSVREDADLHLSLISQGKYTNLVNKYDSNYYYPASAGKDVDIVFLDSSFNFGYSEFSNKERHAECVGIVVNGKVSTDVSGGCNISNHYHGESTTVSAAGLTHGVASRANVYGIALATDERGGIMDSDILGGVQYIYENLIRPYRTVVNFSLGGPEDGNSSYFFQLKKLMDGINEKGGLVVASAGNDGKNLDTFRQYYIPCEYDSVICVGGTDNAKKRSKDMYGLVYFSNYGKNVTVYAPSNIEVEIIKNNRVVIEKTDGTSFSSPIVAGLVATIIGEDTDVKYTKKLMVDKLYQNGEGLTLTLTNGNTGILANNGKRFVYSGEKIKPKTTTTTTTRARTTTTARRTTTTTTTTRARLTTTTTTTTTTRRTTTTTTRARTTTTTTTTRPQPTQTYACPGASSGYSCCKRCNVWYTDRYGDRWGFEGFRICSIKYSC